MRTRDRRLVSRSIVVLLAASVLVGIGVDPAATQPVGTSPIGVAPSLPAQAAVTNDVSAGASLHLTVVLQPRDPQGLASLARDVSDPASPSYRQFLAPGEFAARFGPTDATLNAVQNALAGGGLGAGKVAADRLAVSFTTTAGRAASAFGVKLHEVRLADGRIAYANDVAPRLPANIAPAISAILGLDDLEQARPSWRPGSPTPTEAAPTTEGALTTRAARTTEGALTTRAARTTEAAPTTDAVPTTEAGAAAASTGATAALAGPQPCATAQAAALTTHGYTADQLAKAYSFGGLYAANTLGAGVTVAVYELASYQPSDVATFQACYGTSAQVTNIAVDGGPDPNDGGGIEVELDVEGVISMAPKATIAVYLGRNGGAGPYDTYNRIVSDGTAKVITTSWGNCEAFRSNSQASNENVLFQQAAIQGQTVLAASGDSGSEDCFLPDGTGNTALGVDDPSAQPFVTGVGGTKLSALGPAPTETVWNESASQLGAGGGGISRRWQLPPAQHGPGVINSYSTRATCNAPVGVVCRQVPDVSASSDPLHGYMIYYTGSETGASGWQSIAGTSAAAPLWAALIALADQSCACSLGFINSSLYNIAAAGPGWFNDVTTGNNDYLGIRSGAYPATAGYDMGSGLGTPIATNLAFQLDPQPIAPAFTADSPPTLAAVNTPYSYTFTATGRPLPTFSIASGAIPAGLTLSTRGVLSGTPTTPASSTFTVAASNGVGSPAVSPSITVTVNQATMTYPTDGQSGVDTTLAFTWSTIPEAQAYLLIIGTTRYGADLVNSGILSPANSSLSVPALPAGPTLYATLFAQVGGGWNSYQAVTFTAAPGQATFTFPLNGQSSVDPTRAFSWSTIPQSQGSILVVGTSQFGANVANSGILPPTQSSYSTPILPSGTTLYATLLTKVNGAFTRFQAIAFTTGPAAGTFTLPVNGQINVVTPGAFTWSTIAAAQNYFLVVGTTLYGSDLVNSGLLAPSVATFTVPALPKGKVLYATLLTLVNGTWTFQVAGFIAA